MGNHLFHIVEEEAFHNIINMGFSKLHCISRKSLMAQITSDAANLRIKLKEVLTSVSVKHVCVTADCWPVFKK